jgi:DNA modification methylase
MLPDACVDLIYLDPPFFSNRNYEVIWGDEAEVRSFEDRWAGGIHNYVSWMQERVFQLWRVLKPTGSCYLHCDHNASHYLKTMLDEVFGLTNFRNEIVWKRTAAHSDAKQGASQFGRVHDVLLLYVKNPAATFNPQWAAHGQGYIDSHYRNVEAETGRRYRLDNLLGPGGAAKGNPYYEVMGVWRHWRYSKARMEQLVRDGRVIQTRPGVVPQYKRYLDEMPGRPLQDIWDDIGPLNSQAKERLGYPTQKPEALLDRVIQASSNPGDIVLDPFAGCGTALASSQRLKRRWVGIDISPTACSLIKRRMAKLDAPDVRLDGMPTTVEQLRQLKPFEFQNWVIDRITGTQALRKSGDMGVDGWTFTLSDPVQIKQSDRVGREVVDTFETSVARAKKRKGFIVAFSFTRGAREEVARARRAGGPEVHLVTVEELVHRLGYVFGLMGADSAYADPRLAPLPKWEPSRHTVEELFRSATRAG